MDRLECADEIFRFMHFLRDMRKVTGVRQPSDDPAVRTIRGSIEEHSTDNQGKPVIYVAMESAIYDDAPAIVSIWNQLDAYDAESLRRYRRLISIELEGLAGDRHPRKVFDRSPFGVAALVVGTITVWMTVLKTYSGEDLSELLELIRFNSLVGVIWIIGLFVVVWFIVRTHRNNLQIAHLATLARAIDLYLD